MDVCEKIDRFEKHVFDRQLRIAEILGKHFIADTPGDPLSESAFAIISIGLSYFEMIEQFATGESSNNQSDAFFRRGFARVFPSQIVNEDHISHLYKALRCGMYHTAMPKGPCVLTRELDVAIAYEDGILKINPAALIKGMAEHLTLFCLQLRLGKDTTLRGNFEKMFDNLSKSTYTNISTSGISTLPPTFPSTNTMD